MLLSAQLPGGGVEKCCEIQDNTAVTHSMFIDQASMVVRM